MIVQRQQAAYDELESQRMKDQPGKRRRNWKAGDCDPRAPENQGRYEIFFRQEEEQEKDDIEIHFMDQRPPYLHEG